MIQFPLHCCNCLIILDESVGLPRVNFLSDECDEVMFNDFIVELLHMVTMVLLLLLFYTQRTIYLNYVKLNTEFNLQFQKCLI